MNRDISDWRITFADTGVNANIGQRLVAVRKYLSGEPTFLANYADGLTDMHLPSAIERFKSRGKIGNFVSIRPNLSFHAVSGSPDGGVREIKPVREIDLRINTGFFMFRSEIFDYIRAGEELVEEPFQRLIAADQLHAYAYDGFTASMDTFKDKQHFDELYSKAKLLGGLAPRPIDVKRPAAATLASSREGSGSSEVSRRGWVPQSARGESD
jgi:glucose-1-phosphate cytidylyltransferase